MSIFFGEIDRKNLLRYFQFVKTFYQSSFARAQKMGVGSKILLGAALFPLLLASIPFIIFMIYRASKLSKELQKSAEKMEKSRVGTETIKIEGEIIDIPASQIRSKEI